MATILGKGKKTGVLSEGMKKVHTAFENGTELVEEFDAITDELVVRKWRYKQIGTQQKVGEWIYEIGEPKKAFNPNTDFLGEDVNNPIFTRKDSTDFFGWRIRNLFFPKDVYSVIVETKERAIIVRTSNKKYFKKFNIPDLDRKGLPLDEKALNWDYQNNTLLILYKKPEEIKQEDILSKKERAQMKFEKEGDVQCPTQ